LPFAYIIWRPQGRFGVSFAAFGLGLTIAAMHFTGMKALIGCGQSAYSPSVEIAAVAVGMIMSGLAINAAKRRERRYNLILASLLLMSAICGLHFIAMAGFSIGPPLPHPAPVVPVYHVLLAPLIHTEWLAVMVTSVSGVVLIAAFSAAMTDRRIGVLQAHEANKLRHQARHDELTGLPNRLFLRERLEEARSAPEGQRNFAVLILDLDRFKPVNDLFGWQHGDLLLFQVVERIRNLIGKVDMAARVGGDKFIILHHASALAGGAIALAEELIDLLGASFVVEGHSILIGASIGIAVYPSEGMATDDFLQDAETALQQARVQGGGHVCLFEPEMRRRRQAQRQLESDFRRAIEGRQFIVHYQPLFECESKTLCGFEALIRWEHPIRGMISPGEFIPFAEKSGLITILGLWVLETACADAVQWPEDLRISVNLSPVQLRAGDLLDLVRSALNKTGLAAHRLELEVTEGALIENPEQAQQTLSRLKDMGVQIAIDDFGTGYSNLSYLRHFPFDRIKIDRSFIKDLEVDAESLLIVEAIIKLGHSLRVGVLAEGIETAGQLQLLREQSCDQVQGYLLGKPVPIATASAMVDSHVSSTAQLNSSINMPLIGL